MASLTVPAKHIPFPVYLAFDEGVRRYAHGMGIFAETDIKCMQSIFYQHKIKAQLASIVRVSRFHSVATMKYCLDKLL